MPDKHKMLVDLKSACHSCGMCDLGWSKAENDLDPHVFSNFDQSIPLPRIMVIGQNPGYNEVVKGEPFVGAAGKNFDIELDKYGIERSKLYITNSVKCYTKDNKPPSSKHIDTCRAFLMMEMQIIKPKFVVTLGAVAFRIMCPGSDFTECLGKIVNSVDFGMKVFPIYHPSPLNLSNASRKEIYERDIKKLCRLMQLIEMPF